MPLRRVRIDDQTWRAAELPRRAEWEAAIRDLLADGSLTFPERAEALHVGVGAQATTLELRDGAESPVASCDVPRSALAGHVTEYVDVVRQIDKIDLGASSARFEALDMAKKLAHDDAARTLRRLCTPLEADHATCRRLWTLLLVLRVDTTRLVGVRGHRPVR